MTIFRQILACMFAILIASPACCCFAASPPAEQAAHSCCGSSDKEKSPERNCDCAAKKQSVAESDKPLPQVPVFNLPPVPEAPGPASIAALPEPNLPAWVTIDTGPPRLRLAIFQRYLI